MFGMFYLHHFEDNVDLGKNLSTGIMHSDCSQNVVPTLGPDGTGGYMVPFGNEWNGFSKEHCKIGM
jgi:hypothetical protein